MKRKTARRLDVSTAALCGAFAGVAGGIAASGLLSAHPAVGVFIAAVISSTVSALIAHAYARSPNDDVDDHPGPPRFDPPPLPPPKPKD